ncbi:MAG: hypothetical protein HYT27_04045 [Parcubacteria group bacterium]|nr:hypothetical protein [Parcubacteria group bacterium]
MNKVQIGQTAIALGIQDGVLLSLGVISQVRTKGGNILEGGERAPTEIVSIHTTIDTHRRYAGGPLININGEILGINVITDSGEQMTVPAGIVSAFVEQFALQKTQ